VGCFFAIIQLGYLCLIAFPLNYDELFTPALITLAGKIRKILLSLYSIFRYAGKPRDISLVYTYR